MNPELIDRLREDFIAAGYTRDAVADVLGAEADAARERGAVVAASGVLASRDTSPVGTLIRLFLLGEPCTDGDVDAALTRIGCNGALDLGLVKRHNDGTVGAALSVNPVHLYDSRVARAHWWIISDLDDHLRAGPARPDHVMGVGGATRSLIAMLPPDTVEQALDLGTGCGVIALHLALRGPVTATDISHRALTFAAANARLNATNGITFRHGDLYDPVTGERFDLIATNPPFVISPPTDGERYEYRDAGYAGDRLIERVVTQAPHYLRSGATFLSLANWEYHWGRDGLTRVEGWARSATGAETCDGWIIERDRLDPAQYAETWARDGGVRVGTGTFTTNVHAWLQDFSSRRVTRIGLGSIRLRRSADVLRDEPGIVRAERAGDPLDTTTVGVALQGAFDTGVRAARMEDDEVLETHWRLAPHVREIREHRPGEESPHAIVLHSDVGISRRVVADTLLAAAAGACDGELSLRQITHALSALLEVDAEAVERALVPEFRELAWLGLVADTGSY